ncbi:MAG: TRAP transporter large permease subunit [Rhodovibrionaceae bacterium]
MTSIAIGAGSCVVLLILLLIGVPVAIALGLISVVGIIILRGVTPAYDIAATLPYDFADHWSLAAVPMFLLMGSVVHNSGLTASLFAAARAWCSQLPGGLAIATNFASAGFAAASGSSMATAAAMGRIAIPEMLRAGYDPRLATAVVAASGTLGSLIPPSILIVIYGWMTEQPIGKLLIAGIVPGVLTAIVYALMISGRVILQPEIAPSVPAKANWRERWLLLLDVWPLPVLIMGVIGSIYSGLATVTEAAALGALLSMAIAGFKHKLTLRTVLNSAKDAVEGTAVIFLIAIGAILFTRFLAMAGLPAFLAIQVEQWAVEPWILLIGFVVTYIVLGAFLDPMGIMLITVPVFTPIFLILGFDLIWIGILVIKLLEIGLITPPVGLNAFVIKGVVGDEIGLEDIFKGLAWFVAAELLILLLLILFPQIILFVPNSLM